MGHHINSDGQFQSDKYPELPPDKMVLSFKDKHARYCLLMYAKYTSDKELAEDIRTRYNSIIAEEEDAQA